MYNATNSKYITGVNIDVKEKNPVINHAILIDHNPFLQTCNIDENILLETSHAMQVSNMK
jgi:hypothetical protein